MTDHSRARAPQGATTGTWVERNQQVAIRLALRFLRTTISRWEPDDYATRDATAWARESLARQGCTPEEVDELIGSCFPTPAEVA